MDAITAAHAKVLFTRLVTYGRLRQLQLLVAVDECGSISRAATRLNMSQSAATQAITELERLVDMKLFERHARGIRSTAGGRTLLAAARGSMSRLLQSSESLAAIQRGATEALNLGAIPAAAHVIVSELLGAFCRSYPNVHTGLQEATTGRLVSQLVAGNLDAAFCRSPDNLPDGFIFHSLLDDDAVVIASSRHPLAGIDTLTLQSLVGARWIVPAVNLPLREIFDTLVLRALPDAPLMQVSTISFPIVEELLQDLGTVTLVPRSVSTGMVKGNRVCRLDVPLFAFLPPLGIAYRESNMSAPMQSLLKLALAQRNAREMQWKQMEGAETEGK